MSKSYCETCGAAKKDFCCCARVFSKIKLYSGESVEMLLREVIVVFEENQRLKKQLEEAVEIINQVWSYDSNGEPWVHVKKLSWKFLEKYRGEK